MFCRPFRKENCSRHRPFSFCHRINRLPHTRKTLFLFFFIAYSNFPPQFLFFFFLLSGDLIEPSFFSFSYLFNQLRLYSSTWVVPTSVAPGAALLAFVCYSNSFHRRRPPKKEYKERRYAIKVSLRPEHLIAPVSESAGQGNTNFARQPNSRAHLSISFGRPPTAHTRHFPRCCCASPIKETIKTQNTVGQVKTGAITPREMASNRAPIQMHCDAGCAAKSCRLCKQTYTGRRRRLQIMT